MEIVKFYSHDRALSLKDRKRLKQFLIGLFKIEKKKFSNLTYIFCSDEYLLDINNEFLKHDFYTDVVTFDLSLNKEETIGEIYISVDRVRDNAKKANITLNSELHRVIFHAALHLCGYKDKKTEERTIMEQKEDFYLKKYFNQLFHVK